MNTLQTFLEQQNTQARSFIQEAFTLAGITGTFYGTFGDPQLVPVMTRDGYQDHLVTPLKVQASQLAALTPTQLDGLAHSTLTRTQTGRAFHVQMADYTGAVIYTFILTDRKL